MRRSSSDWSNLGSDYDEARRKANQVIINVNQFFPLLDSEIRVYKDKMSYLGDNSVGKPLRPFPNVEGAIEKSGTLPSIKEEEVPPAEAPDTQTEDSTLFATELDGEQQQRQRQATSTPKSAATGSHDDEWTADRKRKILTMKQTVEEAVARHYRDAMLALKQGDDLTAMRKLHRCIALRPDDADFYHHRAELFVRQCDFRSAIANYRKCMRLQPEAAGSAGYWDRLAFLYLFYGQTLFDQGYYAEALENFAKASEMQPDNVAYQTRSIACLTALGRHSECLALVNKRLETNNSNPDLYVMRARLHFIFKSYTLAYYDAKDALAISPGHSGAAQMRDYLFESARNYGRQAVELAINGRLREAHKKASLAIDMDPSVAEFHVRRAALNRRLGDFNAAVEDCLMAMDKCDHDPASKPFTDAQRQLLLTFNDFAVECYMKGFYEESVGLLEKAIKAEKGEKALYINRGDCFYRLGRLQFAQLDYEQAWDLDPNDSSIGLRLSLVHHRMGQAAFQEKDFAKSVDCLTRAIERNPLCHHLWTARGRSRYFQTDLKNAQVDLAVALLLKAELDEAMRTLLTRLFPSVPTDKILTGTTGLRQKAEKELARYYQSPQPESPAGAASQQQQQQQQQQQHTDSPDGPKAGKERRRRKKRAPKSSIPSVAECAKDRQLNCDLVRDKSRLGR
uniref:TPR_REGION domain-containing protein n=1 Tax=Macrostomum lignano TaxID=282301 RepID=A0A1I8J5W5_9PLAT